MAALVWGAATDAGRIRETNEDSFVAESMVFVVADGMGGHQAGEVASELAARTLRERLVAGAPSADVVVAAVVEANAAIFQTAHNNAAQRGMGTTLTAIAVLPPSDERPEQFAIVNVGDSRAYLARAGELTRATVDHSYVQELLATGHITELEARTHPRRNIVTRALGIEPSVRVDSWVMPVVRGDRFMVCSDGLVDEVDDDEIHEIMDAHPQAQAAAEALVAAAVANGGRDNVTVIVIDVVDGLNPEGLPDGDVGEMEDDTVTLDRPSTGEIVADPATPATAPSQQRLRARLPRQVTARTFLVLLGIAVLLTVVITLIAVALTGGDDSPSPTTVPSTTVPVTTTVPASTTTRPTTTTTRPTSTTTATTPTTVATTTSPVTSSP